jgi:hypothetical protein
MLKIHKNSAFLPPATILHVSYVHSTVRVVSYTKWAFSFRGVIARWYSPLSETLVTQKGSGFKPTGVHIMKLLANPLPLSLTLGIL